MQSNLNSSDNSTHNSSYLLPDVAGSLTFRKKDYVNFWASAETSQSVPVQIALEDLLAAKYLMTALKASAKGI